MKTKNQKVHKVDTESELEISDNKESDSSSSKRVVKYICKKKKLHKKRKVKKVPSSEIVQARVTQRLTVISHLRERNRNIRKKFVNTARWRKNLPQSTWQT